MSCVSSFYDHWMARYLTKHFLLCKTARSHGPTRSGLFMCRTGETIGPQDRWPSLVSRSVDGLDAVFYIISPSIDARDMILPPFDAPQWGESNELLIVFLRSLDGEIFTVLWFFLSFGVSKISRASKLVLKGNLNHDVNKYEIGVIGICNGNG